jgi:hypothetical protein
MGWVLRLPTTPGRFFTSSATCTPLHSALLLPLPHVAAPLISVPFHHHPSPLSHDPFPQTAIDQAGNEGNVVVLHLIVLAQAPSVGVVVKPPLTSRNPNVSMTVACDLDAFLVGGFLFEAVSDSAPVPCRLPWFVPTNGTAPNATWMCDGLPSGVYR